MRVSPIIFWLVGLILFCSCHHAPESTPSTQTPLAAPTLTTTPEPVQLSATWLPEEESVRIKLPWASGRLYRGYQPIYGLPRENRVMLEVRDGVAHDRGVPSGVTLSYLALPEGAPSLDSGRHERAGAWEQNLSVSVTIPQKPLPAVENPVLWIDKANYTLSVVEGRRVQKRYPVALGADPANRKYCQDMKSTPEGWYQIYNLQPDATYHKAYDLDYPRTVDHLRLALAIETGDVEAGRPIGGEIQIHGKGTSGNWTAGCVALRDEDMDELFACKELGVGLPVYLYGYQFDLDDQDWLLSPSPVSVRKIQEKLRREGYYRGPLDGQLGNQTALALGRYQRSHDLPRSCQLDHRTRIHFGLTER